MHDKSTQSAAGIFAVMLMFSSFVRAASEPTAAEARDFVAKAEADLAQESEYLNRAGWVQATYITDDTSWLLAKASAEGTDAGVRYAKEAARFDHVKVDDVTARKLYLLKQSLVLPRPAHAGASQELATIAAKLDTDYSTAKFTYNGRVLTLDDMEDLLRTSRDPNETRALWEGWRAVSSPQMKSDYARLVELANEGSQELGYADTGTLWRSWYDMPPEAFASKVDALWTQVQPLYAKLQCYVRGRLSRKYGPAVQPMAGPIRADLVGNMWSQAWGNIYDIVAPKGMSLGYDLTAALQAHGYDAVKIVHTADEWYQSIGFEPEPASFWERSMITPAAGSRGGLSSVRMGYRQQAGPQAQGMSYRYRGRLLYAHHELGHTMYQRAYENQPFLFQEGANDGFHEAIGDFAGLNAVTPDYLKQLGLIEQVPGAEADIPYLLRMALDKVPIVPFAIIMDKWRWGYFREKSRLNTTMMHGGTRGQVPGLMPPGPRPANAFDPGAKYHIADNTPYARYFLADIYEFQFYRAACRLAGWKGPLNRCSIYRNKEVGAKFAAMLKLGQSKPWPEALAAFSGERDIDASAIIDYFAPLPCGWIRKIARNRANGEIPAPLLVHALVKAVVNEQLTIHSRAVTAGPH